MVLHCLPPEKALLTFWKLLIFWNFSGGSGQPFIPQNPIFHTISLFFFVLAPSVRQTLPGSGSLHWGYTVLLWGCSTLASFYIRLCTFTLTLQATFYISKIGPTFHSQACWIKLYKVVGEWEERMQILVLQIALHCRMELERFIFI